MEGRRIEDVMAEKRTRVPCGGGEVAYDIVQHQTAVVGTSI